MSSHRRTRMINVWNQIKRRHVMRNVYFRSLCALINRAKNGDDVWFDLTGLYFVVLSIYDIQPSEFYELYQNIAMDVIRVYTKFGFDMDLDLDYYSANYYLNDAYSIGKIITKEQLETLE